VTGTSLQYTSVRILAGFLCIFAGLGLLRYAFTPLLPALIEAGWTSRAGGAWLGAINFSGYLAGAWAAHHARGRFGGGWSILAATLVGAGSLVLAAADLGWWVLAASRALAGVSGGVLFVLVPSAVLSHLPRGRRHLASGLLFAGSGVGTVAASLVLPSLLDRGIGVAWLGLAVGVTLVAALSVVLVRGCEDRAVGAAIQPPLTDAARLRRIRVACLAYALFGVAIVPHTLLLSDYLFEHFGVPVAAASERFALFGVGSLAGGALIGGWCGRWWTPSTRLIGCCIGGLLVIAAVPLAGSAAVAAWSALPLGLAQMGCVSVMSLRVAELAGIGRHSRYWGRATLIFGIGYAGGAAIMASALSAGGGFTLCFWLAAIAMAAAAALYAVSRGGRG
jgi:predicted MFS family arabinose efflux permease